MHEYVRWFVCRLDMALTIAIDDWQLTALCTRWWWIGGKFRNWNCFRGKILIKHTFVMYTCTVAEIKACPLIHSAQHLFQPGCVKRMDSNYGYYCQHKARCTGRNMWYIHFCFKRACALQTIVDAHFRAANLLLLLLCCLGTCIF